VYNAIDNYIDHDRQSYTDDTVPNIIDIDYLLYMTVRWVRPSTWL